MTVTTSQSYATDAAATIERHRKLIQTQSYKLAMRIWTIETDPQSRSGLSPEPETQRQQCVLDFYGHQRFAALGNDGGSLLLVDAVLKPDRKTVGLPDIPDPHFRLPEPTAQDLTDPGYLRRKVEKPMIEQRLQDRARARLPFNGGSYLVFGPVLRVAAKPELGDAPGQLWMLAFGPDLAGRETDFLVDEATGEGFFVFGRFEVRQFG